MKKQDHGWFTCPPRRHLQTPSRRCSPRSRPRSHPLLCSGSKTKCGTRCVCVCFRPIYTGICHLLLTGVPNYAFRCMYVSLNLPVECTTHFGVLPNVLCTTTRISRRNTRTEYCNEKKTTTREGVLRCSKNHAPSEIAVSNTKKPTAILLILLFQFWGQAGPS